MTPEERRKPSIINPQRKRRIAVGSGMKVEDVNLKTVQALIDDFNTDTNLVAEIKTKE